MSEDSLVRSLKAANEGKQELIDDCLREIGENRTKIVLLEDQIKRYQVYNHEKHLIILKLKGLLGQEKRAAKADKK